MGTSAACRSSSRWRGCATLAAGAADVGAVGDDRQSRRARATRCWATRRSRARIVRGVDPKTVVIDAAHPARHRAIPVGRAPRHADAAAGRRRDRGRRQRARVHQHPLADRDLVSGASSPRGPTGPGMIALHHGSLDRKRRDWVEDGLRTGRCAASWHVDARPRRRFLAGRPRAAGRQPEGRRAAAPARGAQRAPPGRREPSDVRADECARAGRGGGGAGRRASAARSRRGCRSSARSTCSPSTS